MSNTAHEQEPLRRSEGRVTSGIRVTSRAVASVVFTVLLVAGIATSGAWSDDLFAETFDVHWESLRDDYPYFELYGVDWEAERREHRPRAVAAENPDEFAWELARMLSALPDPHVSFQPAIATIKDRWSVPDLDVRMVERRPFVVKWPDGQSPEAPAAFVDDPLAYPEILAIEGVEAVGSAEILAGGPLGTTFEVRLRWPDDSETDHVMRRPDVSNIPPPKKHFGVDWLVTGRVGSVGYMHVKTFDPALGTLGSDGKMTTMLRAALAELGDTDALILDFQGNGGGLVGASDPFLGNIITKTLTYRWGNSGGKRRVIRPRSPRYRGDIVALVDGRSASGGEWAARILRDAGRAKVVGEPSAGAEAAVQKSEGPDGSVVRFGSWPMVEPGVTPFQRVGVELDHAFPLTIDAVRERGLDQARADARRARFAKALELLGAPKTDLQALIDLAGDGSRER